MADAGAGAKSIGTDADEERDLTDGFHLVIDALKLDRKSVV